MKYEYVWNAVDNLAKLKGLSPSGLAKKAGLDSTTFNKSKRTREENKKRWPSLDSINKVLEVCNISFEDFYKLGSGETNTEKGDGLIPYAKISRISKQGVVQKNNIETTSWGKVRFPDSADNLYAIDIDVDDFAPIYKQNSLVVVAKNSEIRRGDRIVMFLKNGKVFICQFIKRGASTIEVFEINDFESEINIKISDIKLINRIVWASQ